jgi:hypothetical protein
MHLEVLLLRDQAKPGHCLLKAERRQGWVGLGWESCVWAFGRCHEWAGGWPSPPLHPSHRSDGANGYIVAL